MGFWDWFKSPVAPALPAAPPIRIAAGPVPVSYIQNPNATLASPTCWALIAQEEGCKLKAYPDVDGVYVIGYGNKIFDGVPVVKGQTTDMNSAARNMHTVAQQCAAAVCASVKVPLTQGQLDGLTDFVYNVGLGGFQRSTILRTLNARQPVTESMFTVWNKIHKDGALVVLPDLTIRRQREYQLFIL